MKNNRMGVMAALAALVTAGAVSSMAQDYRSVVLSFDPYAYWRLGETSGTVAADEVAGRNGTYTANQTLGQTGAIKGDSDKAVAFNGSGYITAPLDFQSGNVTMVAWIKRNGSQAGYTTILFDRGSSAAGIDLVDNQVCYHWNDTRWDYSSGLVTEDGQWNMVALVVDPTGAQFYLGDSQGNLTTARDATGRAVATFTSSFTIGGDSVNTGRRFNGVIDEPAIFNKCLSAADIETIFRAGLGDFKPGTATIIPSQDPFYAGEGTLTASVSGAITDWQWYKDGAAIVGATEMTLSGDLAAGSYTVTGKNKSGSSTSAPFTIQPAHAPIITSQPVGGGKRYLGGRVNLVVGVEGSEPMTYQWKLSGKDIPDATSPEYAKVLEAADFGSYTLTISNKEGTVTSDAVTVTRVDYIKDSFTQSIMERNPLAYYRFDDVIDEGAGWLDDQGNPVTGYAEDYAGGHTGYYYDVGSQDLIDGAIKEDSSKSVHFWGSSYVGTRLQLNGMSKSGFTTMGWVRRSQNYGEYTTRGGYFGQNDLNEFGDANNVNQIECWCANGLQIVANHNFKDDVWKLVTLTYDGSLLTLYLDGLAVGTSKGTLDATAGTSYYFNVGGGGIFNRPDVNMDYFTGDIDEIAMFDTCMTAADVLEFYYKGFYGPGSAPEVTVQPVSLISYENPESEWTMSVTAGGTSPLVYQWYKDGVMIEGANDRIITGYYTEEYVGSYYVTIENQYGSAKSDTATVSLRVPAPGSYEAIVKEMNPLAYWRLGDPVGSKYAAEYVNGLYGIYTTQTLGKAGAVKGDSDTAVGFDGASHVTIPGMSWSGNTVTFLCWVKPNGVQVDFTELMFQRGSQKASGLDLVGNQVCYHWLDAAATYDYRSGLVLADGVWNLVAMVVTPSNVTFYLGDANGRFDSAVNTATHDSAKLDGDFAIGGTISPSATTRNLNGDMDEVAIFTRALSREEIEAIYSAGIVGPGAKPEITTQPAGYAGFEGDTARLTVTALGSAPLKYQWFRGNEILIGQTNATMVIESATVEDSGLYNVTVSNDFGSASSDVSPVEIAYSPYSIDLSGPEYKLWTHLRFDNDYSDSSAAGNNAYDAGGMGEFGEGIIGTASLKVVADLNVTGILSYAGFENPLELKGDPITVSLWAKVTPGTPLDLPFLCNNGNSLGDYGLTLSPGFDAAGNWGASLKSYLDDPSVYVRVEGAAGSAPQGEWYNMVYVMTPGKTMKVFINGELVSTTDISKITIGQDASGQWSLDTEYEFYIGQAGGSYSGDATTEILIDDMGIWRTALSDIEARSIYRVAQYGHSFDEDIPDTRAPEIVTAPTDVTVYQNDEIEVAFSVEADGKQPITYTWTKDGVEVGTGTTLVVKATEAAAGSYTVKATNDVGSKTATAVLAYRTPAAGYEAALVAMNPYAYWRFDDDVTKGTAADFVRGLNGEYVNVTADKQIDGALFDDPSKAIAFDGTNSNSLIRTPLQLNPMIEDGAFTMMGWVNSAEWVGYDVGYFGQNDLVEFGRSATNEIRCWAAGISSLSAPVPPTGEWALIVVNYQEFEDGSVETIYLNGQVAGQMVKTTPITATAGMKYFFNVAGEVWNSTGGYFTGAMDEIAVFARVLSAEEVAELYNIGKYGPGSAPEIRTQPVGATDVYVNDGTLTLSVVPGGTPPLTVEWYLNGEKTAYVGETVDIARIPANAGSWVAKVSNPYGSTESEPAVISYYAPESEYEALIASLDPWAYWRLGETPEDASQVAAEHAHGITAPYTTNNVLGLVGAIYNDPDTAVSFTGAPVGDPAFSTILVPDIKMGMTTEATFMVWVKRDGDQVGYTPLVFNRGGSGSTTGLNIRENNKLGYHWNDASFSWSTAPDLTLEDGEWNFAALVVTPTDVTFYLGDSQGNFTSESFEQEHAATTLTSDFTLGGQTQGIANRQFKGLLDEPAVFNHALDAATIEKIYLLGYGAPVPPPPTGPEISMFEFEGNWYMSWDATLGAVLQCATSADAAVWMVLPDANPEGELVVREGEKSLYYRLYVPSDSGGYDDPGSSQPTMDGKPVK